MSHIKPFRQFEHLSDDPPEHVAYLVHLDPPYIPEGCENDRSKWVCHYLGSTEIWRLMKRIFTDHGTAGGARVLQVQKEAGGTWHLVRTWAGGRDKEVQLKQRSGTSYCPEPQCAGEHARPGSSRPTGRYTTRRQREAAQRAREAPEASRVRDARETAYAEMQKQFRGSQEISEEAFWELEPHIERLEAQWRRELREREPEMPGRQSRATAREHAQQDAEADALYAEADRLDDLAELPRGYRHEITAERAARIRAQLGEDLARDALAQASPEAAGARGPGPEFQGAERDAEIDRLAQQYPEPGEAADYYRPAHGSYQPDWIPQPGDVSPTAWDRYLSSRPGSAKHKTAYADMHREAESTGFPGPDPDQSYLADHGYRAYAAPWLTREDIENGAEPDDAYRPDEPGPDGASWGPQLDAPDHLYGAPECAEADPETAHFGEHSPEADDRGHWPLPRVLDPGHASPALAPVAAALPDGTPHADPFLAGRGWQAHGGVYVRQPQAQAEAV